MKLLRLRGLLLTFITTIAFGIINPALPYENNQPVQAATITTNSNQLLAATNKSNDIIILDYKIDSNA